ncbi:MAG TPA: M1 family metallopeptidase [Kofleriaceae bacterium]|jgi:aminopeptidase N
MRTLIVASFVVVACQGSQPPPVAPSQPAPPPAPIAAQPDPTPPAFRLPTDVMPAHQTVELAIDPTKSQATGSIHVDANVVKSTRVVWMNATDLHVHDATLAGKPARVIEHGDVIGLVADADFPVGPLAIDAKFDAPIDAQRSRGMYSAADGSDSYVYTFFEPIDARRAFPCFDEPSFKIPWTLVFHVREHDVALGNAPVAKETPEAGGMKRVELAVSKPLPSYLVAFVVGPFDVIDDGLAGRANTPVRFIVPKGHAGELEFAKQITPRIVGALEDYFDMPYPFVKLDVAVVPRFWGTMEHPGIVALGQPLTLIKPEQDTRDREERYTNIAAHELGHYWFGDLVTMKWWDDIWLNEALGEWLDMITTDAVMPKWHYRDRRLQQAMRGMSADETASVKPMHREIKTKDDIEGSFDNEITYYKGASVMRACEAFVGAEKWQRFIRGYIHKHAGGNADDRDFVTEMRAALGDAVATGFDTYVHQAGVPVVSVTCEKDHLAIHKGRSLPAGMPRPPTKLISWPIPVCVRYGDTAGHGRACTTKDSVDVDRCPAWIEPNDNATGYYRSVIDPKLLDAKTAKDAKLSPFEKRMALYDLRSMVKRDQLSIDVAIARAAQLAKDPDPVVALTGVDESLFRDDAFDDAFHAAADQWRIAELGGLARALSWHRAPGDSDDREKLREELVSLVARVDPAFARQGAKIADEWLAKHSKLDDGLLEAALQAAAQAGDAARFARYVAAAKAASTVAERDMLVGALGEFRSPELAKQALDLVLGHDLDIRDTWRIVAVEASRWETRDLALAFLQAHLAELMPRLRDDEQGWLTSALVADTCDAAHRDAFAALVKPYAAKFDAITRGLEKSQQCIEQMSRQRTALDRLVKKN